MRIIVTGAAGQLGRELLLHCSSEGDDVIGLDRREFDLTSPDSIRRAVRLARPDVVVNCAAFTAVDACESTPDEAMVVNGTGVGHLADAVVAAGAHLVHLSTDYVFDGRKRDPYVEGDEPNPESVYGRTKLAGEQAVGDRGTIVRTSWVCGEHGANMVKTVLGLAERGRAMTFVDDQRANPSFTADLAPALRRLAFEQPGGIFHLTNARAVSWYEFVREILEEADFDPAMVSPISTAELEPARPAPRPANSVLENAAWAECGWPPLRDHAEPLHELVRRLR